MLIQFFYLQLLDLLTTLAFLMNGVQEGNPVVRLALAVGPAPIYGLVVLKLAAIAMAVYCVRRARLRLLSRVNVFFAMLIAWNLVALILASKAVSS